MTLSGQSDGGLLKVWPRTEDGRCSCPYCTAAREGRLPPVEAPRKRDWLERMGGRGHSVASEMVRDGFAE